MKKIIMIVALVFGGIIAVQAQEKTLKQEQHTLVTPSKKANPNSQIQKEKAARQAEMDQAALQSVKAEGNFKSVSVSSLSPAVMDVVAKKYNGATISSAALDSEKGFYKLTIADPAMDSGTNTVYISQSELKN